MGIHHIADGDQWKMMVPGLPGGQILAQWPGSAIAGAENIGANDKVLCGIDYMAGTHHAIPPVGGVRIGSQGMTDPYHVAFRGIKAAIGMIRNG